MPNVYRNNFRNKFWLYWQNFICLGLNFHCNWINLSKLKDQIELQVIERSKNWNSINFQICHKFFYWYTFIGNAR